MFQVSEVLQNILIGLLGAGIAALTSRVLSKLQKWRLQKRFPIAGNYISYFEDELDGRNFVETSRTTIVQSGLNFKGINHVQDGKSWNLQGRIADGAYLSGVYLAESPYDPGNGTFFLRVEGDDLEGLWSGYDSVNHSITGGRYWFRRMKKIRITDYNQKQSAQALSIADSVLGAGYLHDLADGEGLHEVKTKFAVEGEKIIGFVSYNLENENFLSSSEKYERAKFSADLRLADSRGFLGHIRIVGIDEAHQGRGVGTLLVKAAETHLLALGAQSIIVFGWTSPKGTHIGGVVEKLGYTEIESVDNFWKDESKKEKYDCAICGNPCVCSVKIYKKTTSNV